MNCCEWPPARLVIALPSEAAETVEAAAGEAAAAAGLRKPIRDDCLTLGLGPEVGPGDGEGVNVAVAVAAAGSGLTEEEGWAGEEEALLGRC